jgi:hypothetical protein
LLADNQQILMQLPEHRACAMFPGQTHAELVVLERIVKMAPGRAPYLVLKIRRIIPIRTLSREVRPEVSQ